MPELSIDVPTEKHNHHVQVQLPSDGEDTRKSLRWIGADSSGRKSKGLGEGSNSMEASREGPILILDADETTIDRSAHVIASVLALIFGAIIVSPPFALAFLPNGSTLGQLLVVSSRAALITSCMLIGELATMSYFHANEQAMEKAEMASALSDIWFGPIVIISFFQSDFMGTFLFIGALWHFLADHAGTRASHVLIVPWRASVSRKERANETLQWFISWMTLIHHYFVACFKLGKDAGVFGEPKNELLAQISAFTLYGGALSHLSYAMSHFGIPGAVPVRGFSILVRVGGDIASVVLTDNVGFRIFMCMDIVWMTTMISLCLAHAYTLAKIQNLPITPAGLVTPPTAPEVQVHGLDEELGHMLHRMRHQLVTRSKTVPLDNLASSSLNTGTPATTQTAAPRPASGRAAPASSPLERGIAPGSFKYQKQGSFKTSSRSSSNPRQRACAVGVATTTSATAEFED